MKKILALIALAIVLGIGGWWFFVHRAADRFDYTAAFERPAASSGGASLVDVVALAGKRPQDISALLGSPQQCEPGQFSERCRYGGIGVEITYIKGRADWITVPMGGADLAFAPDSLKVIGLPSREPDAFTEHEDIWHGLAGYREVVLSGTPQGAIYARIKVSTP
ncbi:hypothetical protein [Solimonas marina]|uniref:Uncharacterized protein n=1 Tax=Solimonas marina TaxID=2714601 RepID=A0A969W9Y8_9GAMM|nr:hypothetical protein [Solimonas marina]NKF23372.1 hypothetical protein [Solimonas marina]